MIFSALSEQQVDEVCGDGIDLICRLAADFASSTEQLRVVKWVVDRPVAVLVVVAIAFFANRLGRKFLQRWARRIMRDGMYRLRSSKPLPGTQPEIEVDNGRSEQRIETLIGVLTSLVTVVIWSVAFVVALGLFDINLAPLIAGAGVVGVALGFGAQSVVGDFLAGFFMLFEDQYGVGDVIDAGEASGVVEKFSLRTTTLRDINGTVWHIPNHEIRRVGNKSQLWSRAVLDIEVGYESDLRQAQRIILEVAEELWRDTSFEGGDIIEQPEMLGVETLGADGVVIRLMVKTDPADQWAVARELRLRIKEALDLAGIEIPFPQRTLWVKQANEAVSKPSEPFFTQSRAASFEPDGPESVGTETSQSD